ncbi:PAS domain S-box protein [Myxococcota bacterium]|nr:PAS domain S-box protein [Myxococcota bacterium]MBU1897818.1 PAS domain S-box protein [Myxococcota bacterium]
MTSPLNASSRPLTRAFARPYFFFLVGLFSLFILAAIFVHVVTFERFFTDHVALMRARALAAQTAQIEALVHDTCEEIDFDLKQLEGNQSLSAEAFEAFKARISAHLEGRDEVGQPRLRLAPLIFGEDGRPRLSVTSGRSEAPPLAVEVSDEGGGVLRIEHEGIEHLLYAEVYEPLGWLIVAEADLEALKRSLDEGARRVKATLRDHLLLYTYIAALALIFVTLGTLWLLRRLYRFISVHTAQLERRREALDALNANLEAQVMRRTEALRARDAKARHLSEVLRVLRDISKLIAQEHDAHRLAEISCQRLARSPIYHSAWVMLGEREASPRFIAFEGPQGALDPHSARAGWPLCATEAIERAGVHVEHAEQGRCPVCMFNAQGREHGVFTCRLEAFGRVLGVIGVTLSRPFAEVEEERTLFGELADDLAAALWRLQREAGHRALEAQHSVILEITNDAVIASDEMGRIELFNPAAERLLGYHAEEIRGASMTRLRPRSERARFKALAAQIQARAPIERFEAEILAADGAVKPVEMTLNARWRGERFDGVVAIIRDISARRAAEAALRRSQRQITLNHRVSQVFLMSRQEDTYEDLLRLLCEAFTSEAGCIGYHNAAGRWRVKRLREATYGCGLNEQVEPSDPWITIKAGQRAASWRLDEPQAPRWVMAAPLRHQGEVIGLLTVCGHPEGYTPEDEALLESVAAQVGPLLFGRLEQLRQAEAQAHLQAQLRQAQRMEAIGQLAGGVAHDFNNILQVMHGYTDLLMLEFEEGDEVWEVATQIHKGVERASALTRQLLAFSRRQVLAKRGLELNALIFDLVKMLRRLLGEDIELDIDLCPQGLLMQADPGQLEQVIINLCVNARDAMPEGGVLRLKTARRALTAEALDGCPAGEYAQLTVQDTGCGMDLAVRAQIFDPFFTTKEAGKGTGLGLSTVYGIIKQHEGHIQVTSAPGRGATFDIWLPLGDVALSKPTAPLPRLVEGGRELILLAEDDSGVRRLTRRILKGAGYQVISARDGAEALALIEAHQGEVKLLLSDVVMPKVGGREVLERFRALAPQRPVILMSGYTANTLDDQLLALKGIIFLQKPFEPDLLLRKIRSLLDAGAGEG